MPRAKKWIQRAVKKPGALTEYARRVGCLREDGRNQHKNPLNVFVIHK